jgi:hypothetical protein
MKFKSVYTFDNGSPPMVFYRDPEILYIWFAPDEPQILTTWGWTMWPIGWSIGQVLDQHWAGH